MPLVTRTERLKNPDLTQVYARNADSESWTVLLDYSETGGKRLNHWQDVLKVVACPAKGLQIDQPLQ
jgi:hypothetical protein